jgi:hypothetical protein
MRETFGMNGWEEMSNTLKTSVVEAIADVLKAWKAVSDFSNNLYEWYKWAFGDFAQIITTIILPNITAITGALETVGVTGKAIFDTIKNAAIGATGPVGQLLSLLMQLSSNDSISTSISNTVKNAPSLDKVVSDTHNKVKGLMPWNRNKTSNNIPAVTPPPKVGGGRSGGGRTGRGTTGTHTGSNTPKVEMTEEQKLQKQINELVQQGLKMDEQGRSAQREKIAALQEQLQAYKDIKNQLLGIEKKEEIKPMAEGLSGFNKETMSAWMSGKQKDLSQAEYGSAEYTKISGEIVDMNTIQAFLSEALRLGVADVIPELQSMWEEVFDDVNIDVSAFDGIKDKINEVKESVNENPVEIDMSTGNLKDVKKASMGVEDAMIAAGQAVNQVAGALQNIEDPGVKAAAIVAEAIANVALGFAQASKAMDTTASGWGWLAWLAAGAAAMATTISTIHSLTGFAGGGVVEGNSYSGDNQLVRVNAGETILTRAQAGVIADALEGSPMSNLKLETYVSGKRLRIVMNNDSMSRGQGKLVSSNTLRG